MEYQVDEIFEIDGKKYQTIEDSGYDCKNCSFNHETCWQFGIYCTRYFPKDKKDVCFKLIEE